MLKQVKKLWVITGISLMAFSTASSDAFAWGGHERRDGHDNHAVVLHQPRHETVIISGRKAVIVSLPFGYTTVVIGGTRYYCYDDIFFRSYPSGYVVVPPPVVYSSAAPVPPAMNPGTAATGEIVVINVPNSNGSYSPVKLVKTNNGYIGPQGEFYSGHPTLNQLKTLYGS